MLSDLPRFNAARRYGATLFVIGVAFAVVGSVLVDGAISQATLPWYPDVQVPRVVGYLGAALWMAAAGFLSAGFMSIARRHFLAKELGAKGKPLPPATPRATAGTARQKWRPALASVLVRLRSWRPDPAGLAEWPQASMAIIFGAIVLGSIVVLWRMAPEPAAMPLTLQLFGGALIVLAFPLLVLERIYANLSAELLPEAPQIDRLLRIGLSACVGFAIVLILLSAGFTWAAYLQQLIILAVFVFALEVFLRGAVLFFVPFAPVESRQAVVDSRLAGIFLRLSRPDFGAIRLTVRHQLGIDLSRSWALAFIQRAALPVFVEIGIFAWVMTGVTTLDVNERGVYERLGAPVAVFGPGLHVHLPWPLGIIHPVELGVIHQLPIEFLLPTGNGAAPPEEKDVLVGAEDHPAESSDRLWDNAHPFEGSYLIASQEDGRQSFQLADCDMAVVYRIGMTDQAAQDAAYRVADPEEVIQALSGQLLVQFFSHNTLLDVLGKSRESFSAQFKTELQAQLDQLSSGIEVVTISIEAIHPPPGAAVAYHDVQAAEIRANMKVAVTKGDATRLLSMARQTATSDRDDATATLAELIAQARSESIVYDADRESYGNGAGAFLLERWFGDLTKSLGTSDFTIIDHRLNSADIPTLDLRNFGSQPAAAAAASTDTAKPPANTPSGTAQPSSGAIEGDDD